MTDPYPLPDDQETAVVYDNNEGSAQVTLQADGKLHLAGDHSDFIATDAASMRRYLKRWGYRHVGWEGVE